MRFVALLATVAIGCSSSTPTTNQAPPAANRTEVRGRVTLGGKPVVGATLSLNPDKGEFRPFAVTGPNGEFTVEAPDGVGVPHGRYRVSVFRGIDPGGTALVEVAIPPRYADAATSGLAIDVTASPPPGGHELRLSP
ncbi:MAG: hypothetical protein C0467_24895 [Planctomycetaceae bacterium]|nr:hypothetical protein [Planctomycetaceae bacterium]